MRPPISKQILALRDGPEITIRTMQPEDRELERAFVRGLSANSRYRRFFAAIKELSPTMLDRFTQVDYPRELALIATVENDASELQIAVARYAPGSSPTSAEFAIVVADEWHGRGVGGSLLRSLFDAAKEAGIEQIEGVVLSSNSEMLELAKRLGFDISQYPGDAELVQARKKL